MVKISNGNYRLKVWNSGKATAYNVDFKTEVMDKGIIRRDKVPYEFLEPGKSFEEIVLVHSGTPNKFKMTTIWTDKQKNPCSKEQILSL
jgi:hypothetical protein